SPTGSASAWTCSSCRTAIRSSSRPPRRPRRACSLVRPCSAAGAGSSTAAALSAGRLLPGVGIGYLVGEFEALGLDPAARAGRTDETLALWRAAWEETQPLHHTRPPLSI